MTALKEPREAWCAFHERWVPVTCQGFGHGWLSTCCDTAFPPEETRPVKETK